MKEKRHSLPLFSLCMIGLFFLFSCSDKGTETEDNQYFQVVRTDTDIDYTGGSVVIQTNVDGVEAHSKDTWLTSEVSGSQVRLTASANPGYESRTTMVLLTYGDEIQQVPITQLGIISIVDVYSYDFQEHGGSKGFLWKTDQEYKITGVDPSWLSYEIKGDSIYFKSAALGIYDDTRSCTVNITASTYYNKEVVFRQVAPPLSYELIPGNYTLEYTRWVGSEKLRTDVKLVEKEAGRTFVLKGLAFDITVLFDSGQPGIAIKSQQLHKADNQDVWLAAWEGQGTGQLWPDSRFGVKSRWNGDKKNIEFAMIPDGVIDNTWQDSAGNPVITRGFILWGKNEYTSCGESRLINMKFIKKNQKSLMYLGGTAFFARSVPPVLLKL